MPALPGAESRYERLGGASLELDAHLDEYKPKPRARRDEARELAQGRIIFSHYVNSDEHEPPEEIQELQRQRFTSRAEAEAALDKLDGIVSFWAYPHTKAVLNSVAAFAEHAGQKMRSIRITVTMGMNFTNIEGVAPDAAEQIVLGRLKEATKDIRGDILVETGVIPPENTRAVVIRWDAFDGPISTNATRAAILARHSEL
ncbi:hypothetical protein CEY04_11220 [Achromobacter sp. HZ28]|nr:hypothetical protein CEY05_20760 [Achromobacter sp. HZ34]OWT79535.1 hypothetical protein CEY04_11220 [Achromobacter sp. HZ28]